LPSWAGAIFPALFAYFIETKNPQLFPTQSLPKNIFSRAPVLARLGVSLGIMDSMWLRSSWLPKAAVNLVKFIAKNKNVGEN
jgi:hypothetical protein